MACLSTAGFCPKGGDGDADRQVEVYEDGTDGSVRGKRQRRHRGTGIILLYKRWQAVFLIGRCVCCVEYGAAVAVKILTRTVSQHRTRSALIGRHAE